MPPASAPPSSGRFTCSRNLNGAGYAYTPDLGIVTMRPLTSGIFQKLMRHARPDIEELVDLNELALSLNLSEPAISTAIVGVRRTAEIERNNAISDTARRIDLGNLQDRRVRG